MSIYIFTHNHLINNYEAITAKFTAKYAHFKMASRERLTAKVNGFSMFKKYFV